MAWVNLSTPRPPAQILAAITFTVADLAGNTIGDQTAGHIVIDADAAGHGWFVDSTPNDNSEFTHAANAASTDLSADPASAAAGHLDLLTAVVHEMGHELGLSDLTAASDANDLMYIDLVDGERRLSLEHWLDALDPREALVARRFVKYVLQTLADDKARPAERFEARRELYRRLIAAGIVD